MFQSKSKADSLLKMYTTCSHFCCCTAFRELVVPFISTISQLRTLYLTPFKIIFKKPIFYTYLYIFFIYIFKITNFFIFISVSECQFGKTVRELGTTWYADLGPPFGVMYCIKCECVSVSNFFNYWILANINQLF